MKVLSFFTVSFLLFHHVYGAETREPHFTPPVLTENSQTKVSEMLDDLMFPATSMPDRDWWKALWPNPKEIVLKLNFVPGMSVLDLCCGYGYFTIPLSEVSSNIYGLELDASLIDEAITEAKESGIKNIHWIVGDATHLKDLMPEPVDYVLLANTLHGIPNKAEFIQNIRSILKQDGRFSIVNWHQKTREDTTVLNKPRGPQTNMRMSPDQVLQIVTPLGFELESCLEIQPYHYGLVFKKAGI